MSSPERPPASGPTARRSTFTPALAYSVLTPVYDTALEVLGFGRLFKAAAAELAEVEPGETALDLGCGTGTLLQALVARQPAARFTGIDPDPQVLAVARRLWVPRNLTRPLISAFTSVGRRRGHRPSPAQQDLLLWLSNSRTSCSPAC